MEEGRFCGAARSHQAHVASKEDTMVGKTAVALAAVAVVTFGSTFGAAAMRGGGGGHGGMGHGGMGHGGGFGAAAMAHPGGFGGVAVHSMGLRGGRMAVGDRSHFRHRFVRNRFVFVGGGLPYGYYDDCYARVWTPWGWSWRYLCY
jgi:hypothetical protein